jgi:hypothetical protein
MTLHSSRRKRSSSRERYLGVRRKIVVRIMSSLSPQMATASDCLTIHENNTAASSKVSVPLQKDFRFARFLPQEAPCAMRFACKLSNYTTLIALIRSLANHHQSSKRPLLSHGAWPQVDDARPLRHACSSRIACPSSRASIGSQQCRDKEASPGT